MHLRSSLLALAALTLASAASAQVSDPTVKEDAPVAVDPHLNGLDEAGVRLRLGEPALSRSEGAGALWTYPLERCVLFVSFADAGAGLHVTGLSSGPRRHGDEPPETLACLRQAEASRQAIAAPAP